MYLKSLGIKGFRCFANAKVEFREGVNVLVGRNNSGKTALLQALRLLFRGSSAPSVSVNDFSRCVEFAESEGPPEIEISATLCSSGEDRDTASELGLVATWLTQLEAPWEAQLTFRCFLPAEHHSEFSQELGDSPDQRRYWRTLEVFLPKFVRRVYGGDPSAEIQAEPEYLSKVDYQFLDALRDVETRMFTGRTPLLGSMLRRALDHGVAAGETQKRRDKFRDAADKLVNELLPRLDTERLFSLVEDTGAEAGGKPELTGEIHERDLLAALQLVVGSSEERLPVTYNGLGYNNLLYISLLLASLRFGTEEHLGQNAKMFSVLAIEEPEAHLHPTLQHRLMGYLKRRLTEEESTRQVLVTTHSTHITAAAGLDGLVCLTDDEEGGRKVIYPGRAFGDHAEGRESKRYIERFLDATKSNLLFADGVLLVEGVTEQLLVPLLADYLGDEMSLTRQHVAVVCVGGSTFKHFLPLFGAATMDGAEANGLSTPVACVVDADPSRRRTDVPNARFRSCLPHELGLQPASYEYKPYSSVVGNLQRQARGRANVKVFTGKKTFEYDLALENLGSALVYQAAGDEAKVLCAFVNEPEIDFELLSPLLDDELLTSFNETGLEGDDARRMAFAVAYWAFTSGGKGEHAWRLACGLRDNLEASVEEPELFAVPAYICNAVAWACRAQTESTDGES